MFSIFFFNRAVYEEKHGTARQATDNNTLRRMRFACWVTKSTHTHLEYLILRGIPLGVKLGLSL
jgi:hypothetical protein